MEFFDEVLPETTGWVPVIRKGKTGSLTNFAWFQWPQERDQMAAYAALHSEEDLYFSPFLYKEPPSRHDPTWGKKRNVTACAVVWADGDDLPYESLRIRPTVVVMTSENRWQGYWAIADGAEMTLSQWEDLAHGVAKAHAGEGIDNGWALGKKLRVPGALNTKYETPFRVTWEYDRESEILTYAEFSELYPAPAGAEVEHRPAPTEIEDAFDILTRLQSTRLIDQYMLSDPDDRSGQMYKLECMAWERGGTLEDAFALAFQVSYNKFAERQYAYDDTWAQVCRDYARWSAENAQKAEEEDAFLPTLAREGGGPRTSERVPRWSERDFLDPDEVVPTNTFIDAFAAWAAIKSPQTAPGFHECGALAVLSTLFSPFAFLNMSYGRVPLNLYFLVLGQTTRSRKSTSLRLAESLIREMSPTQDKYLVPSDATPEALSDYCAARKRESSLFRLDEVQDVFRHAGGRNSYKAGLLPFLTEGYDGRLPGVLRKGQDGARQETEHYLTFYGTGILDTSAQYLTAERIASGFVPRCLIAADTRKNVPIMGADDLSYYNPGGENEGQKRSDALKNALVGALKKAHIEIQKIVKSGAFLHKDIDPRVALSCSPDAFARWQRFAKEVEVHANQHVTNSKQMEPIAQRLATSTLKIAGLLALLAGTTIKLHHVIKAISLACVWLPGAEALVHATLDSEFSAAVDDLVGFVAGQMDGAIETKQLFKEYRKKIRSGREIKELILYAQDAGYLKETISKTPAGGVHRVISYTGKDD